MKGFERRLAVISPGSWFIYVSSFEHEPCFKTKKEKIIASISMFACLRYDQQREVEGIGRAMLKAIGVQNQDWPRLDDRWEPGKSKRDDHGK